MFYMKLNNTRMFLLGGLIVVVGACTNDSTSTDDSASTNSETSITVASSEGVGSTSMPAGGSLPSIEVPVEAIRYETELGALIRKDSCDFGTEARTWVANPDLDTSLKYTKALLERLGAYRESILDYVDEASVLAEYQSHIDEGTTATKKLLTAITTQDPTGFTAVGETINALQQSDKAIRVHFGLPLTAPCS
jgi:hypothetical protein